mmetsp:Transcript_2643/g.2968  ORF Transcript_2643/g.2968 Transcript_2643/m.2968 type:complete len:528 (+) Transcript_2643:248-1831(+)|eukprot:CAMPEP_0197846680 /NCGR_PEP_ID=MMETSP1438-20131217/4003_1 /TAXON_ID=1461541 /ORGANISM="Pterosperma sp., Strain CCMP1384" /LENGTH=527 /DNA_ID=CAMNT_0043458403 /DNA_START=241 /DNA_END=1824 /DNA_ORIENTATION=+
MVVLAAAIITKTGKPLLSRQFVDMTRIRIEGLLAAFPKLVGSGKQHTYVETENVRYVYQPMEALYLLLVTNKQSNILEDLETLRLLSKMIPDYCQITLNTYEAKPLDEETIERHAFELLFAIDEILSFGHKENVTMQQVKTFTDMDSHEEKLHKMIIQSKINDTKDVMKKKANEIDKSKQVEKMREGAKSFSMSSISSGPMGGISSEGSELFHTSISSGSLSDMPKESSFTPSAQEKPQPPKKGMVLGKSNKSANQFLEAMKAEGELVEDTSSRPGPVASAVAAPVVTEPVSIVVEEKLSVTAKKDGGLDTMEVQGTMSLEVLSDADSFLHVLINQGANKGFQFKTHPNIDKGLHSKQSILGLKDPARPFPTGSPLGILKWRMQTTDESMVPISINCWPSVSGGESYVSIEYEATSDHELQNVLISVPLPSLADPPQVNQVDGDFKYDARRGMLEWEIELIDDTNRNGSLEFVVPACDGDVFFPIDVHFTCKTTFCDVSVKNVQTVEGEPVQYALQTIMDVAGFQVV